MPSLVRDLGVIGAGPAGLTCAIAARRAGLEVTVFEQANDIRSGGVGITIASNGLRALDRLGLLEEFFQVAQRVTRARVETADGTCAPAHPSRSERMHDPEQAFRVDGGMPSESMYVRKDKSSRPGGPARSLGPAHPERLVTMDYLDSRLDAKSWLR